MKQMNERKGIIFLSSEKKKKKRLKYLERIEKIMNNQ